MVSSGIRIGTPAVTTRGMGVAEMRRIAELIDRVLSRPGEGTFAEVRAEVEELTGAHPLYQARPGRPAMDGARKVKRTPVGALR